jgi:RND family efflux transporter MFP subunit
MPSRSPVRLQTQSLLKAPGYPLYFSSKVIIALFLALMLFSWVGCRSDYPAVAQQSTTASENRTPRSVKVSRVAKTLMERTASVTGTLAAYDQAVLSMKVPGRLKSIEVDLGSVVQRGQKIAQVEPQDYQLRLQQAEAALAQVRARLGLSVDGTDDRVDPEKTGTVSQARAVMEESRINRERSDSLLQQGLISPSQYDSTDATYKVAVSRYQDAIEEIRNRQALLAQRRSELALARQQLADTVIHAPFDGAIQQKQASLGEYLAAGTPVVTLVQMNPLRLRAEVPERIAGSVRAGQKVHVTVEGDSNAYSGRIARLSPAISVQNRMLLVEAEVINNGLLRPGSFARAEIVLEERGTGLTVPPTAIVTFAGIEKVLTVKDGRIVENTIATGQRSAKWVEVLSGVSLGAPVVVDPGNLQTGSPVKVVEQIAMK